MFSKDTLEKTAIKLIAERGQLVDVLEEILQADTDAGGSRAMMVAALRRARRLLKEIDA